jgi:hypothetical protein
MQTFDDQTAPYQIQFEAFGVEMRICTNTQDLLRDVESILPPSARRRPRSKTDRVMGLMDDGSGTYSIYRYDRMPIHDAPGREYALIMLDSQIHGHIALEAEDYVFVHAGAVGDGDRAIVIPGMSFSGKTTLVRALVEAGAVYYSDEFAVFDEAGLMHPYPRRLSVRPLLVGESTTVREPAVETPVVQLGGVAGIQPLPVGMVIATHYRSGADWQPKELSGGVQVLTLLKHAVPAQDRPDQTMRYLARAVREAFTLEGERGDADELAPLLLDALRAAA